MNYLPDAALFLLVAFSLVIAGWCLYSPHRSSLEAAFVPGAAILGTLSWLVWLVGMWKLVPDFWLVAPWPLWLGLVVWKRGNMVIHVRRSWQGLRTLSGLNSVLTFYLAFLFALTFVLTLVPPSGADYDSLVYHLAVPAQYLRMGRVTELPFDHHSYFPLTLEMLYALGLSFRGPVFAKLFHWLMLPIGALALVAIGKRAHSVRAGLIGACLFASMPMVLQEAQTAYIDLGFAAFTFLALLCFIGAPSKDKNENWLWCGAFCGFCLGTKYLGALPFGFLGVMFLLQARQAETNASVGWRQMAYILVPALLIGAPWYVRNVLWTGNPVFPFAYGLFGGKGWTSDMAHLYDKSQAIYGFGKSLPDLVMLPWRLAMTPLNAGVFGIAVKGQPFWPLLSSPAQGPDGIFEVPGLFINIFPGPALFALGIPALFTKGKPREIALCAWFFGFLWFFWAFTSQQIRYLLPALGILALVGGWGVAEFAPRFRIARTLGGLFLALWFVFTPLFTLRSAQSSFPVLIGAVSEDQYLRRTFSGYNAMTYANENTPADAKFAVYGEPRCFYLKRAYFWADDGHNNLIDYAHLKDGPALAAALQAQGATHVLWNSDAGRNGGVYGPPEPLMDQAIAAQKLILVYGDQEEAHGYRIYRVAP